MTFSPSSVRVTTALATISFQPQATFITDWRTRIYGSSSPPPSPNSITEISAVWLLLKVLGPEVVPNHASRAQGEHVAHMSPPMATVTVSFY